MRHGKVEELKGWRLSLSRIASPLNRSTPQPLNKKKTGRRINSPPGLKFRDVTPKAFGVVISGGP
jgi:hypothetical protein